MKPSINYNKCKLYVGCVSRNTVDATIEFANENDVLLGLIPSRRQVDFDGGYIGFTTKELREYIDERTGNVILERDHGGPMQGKCIDNGLESLLEDSKYCDLIHIDPWKFNKSFEVGLLLSKELMDQCIASGFGGYFELSTEQSIREFSLLDLKRIIKECENTYPIKYIVIQSGTSLKNNLNTGIYDSKKLSNYCKLVKLSGLLSKEHNGDYLDSNLIIQKLDLGLDAINIAPEFGFYESQCYIESIKKQDKSLLNEFYQICYDSGQWKKWVSKDFDISDKDKLISICGHYVLENTDFHAKIKMNLPDISKNIKDKIKSKIRSILRK